MKLTKSQRIRIVAKINGLTDASRNLRKKINKEEKEHKFPLINIKLDIRKDARHHNLAYAYMRNIPYKALEAKCNEKPNPELILKITMVHSIWVSLSYYKEYLEKINNWLNGIEEVKCKTNLKSL